MRELVIYQIVCTCLLLGGIIYTCKKCFCNNSHTNNLSSIHYIIDFSTPSSSICDEENQQDSIHTLEPTHTHPEPSAPPLY
jgi:hypothetical protein